MSLKAKIVDLIKQGYSNVDIAEMLNTTSKYADKAREELRDLDPQYAGVKQRRPRKGTVARKIFDCVYWNPNSTNSEIARSLNVANPALSIQVGQVNEIRKRYMPRQVSNES